MARIARIVFLLSGGFVALTAIGGGVAMATGLDEFPPEWLEGTPFASYLVPALMLTLIVGGTAAVAVVLSVRRHPAARSASIVAGAVMMGWIVGEVLILNQPQAPTPIEVAYFLIGLLMAVSGWLMRPSADQPGTPSPV